ncbi:MAG: hypothetical protein HC929_17695 [Leptolyngbyaceae cyanobacterium SM2_5_2]|nr:hypothetical protein [Leptolyngbyaceae cyanobacterium SM2_5_2]
MYGSRAAIDRTIKILHALGFTDPNDWSDPIPLPPTSEAQGTTAGTASPPGTPPASRGAEASKAHTWMAIATKTVLIE